MILPSQIFILKIVSGNYGKLSACLSRHYPDSTICLLDLENLDEVNLLNNAFLVIPGVGSFDQSISRILRSKSHSNLLDVINNPLIPKLAICLGFQILFSFSEETSSPSPAMGLNIYSGGFLKFTPTHSDFIVNTGYKMVVDSSSSDTFGPYYFNHSYYLPDSHISSNLESFNSSFVSKNGSTSFVAGFHDSTRNLIGTQYHPEMSRPSAFLDLLRTLR